MTVRRSSMILVAAVVVVAVGCAPPPAPPVDTVAPVLSLPADMSLTPTGPAGAEVLFTVSATDDVDGVVPVDCVPASGSFFAIGDTTVSCTAVDAAGNVATGGFTVTMNALPGAAAIAAGTEHSCALTGDGAAKCWGWNEWGQLGTGSSGISTGRHSPVDVLGLGSGVRAITTGEGHSCAITGGGAVTCWGANSHGQVGDGQTSYGRVAPINVVGLGSGVQAVAAGRYHTCALTTGGAVKCWGLNSNGQLGDGTTTARTTPVDVVGLGFGVRAITTGGRQTCALTDDGVATCWGRNYWGEVGDGTTTDRLTPVDVIGLDPGVRDIDAGLNHTCAVTVAGAARCWGNGYHGRLGDGSAGSHSTPVDVVGLGTGVRAITAGGTQTCALTDGGAATCWGQNIYGQLGDGTTTDRRTPVDVVGLGSGVDDITAGDDHTCALTDGGGARCWGQNFSGKLGIGNTTNQQTPADVNGFAG